MLQYALDRLARRVAAFDVTRLLWLDVAGLEPAALDDDGLDFRFLSAEEVRTLAADAENCLDAGLGRRARGGRRTIVLPPWPATAWPPTAGMPWGLSMRKHCGQVAVRLPAGAAYFYNGFTRPEFRGRGLYVALMGQGLRALAGRGVRSLLASVHWTNWAALKSCRRLGFTDLGYFVGVGHGRFRLVFPPRAAKRRGIEFRRSACSALPPGATTTWCPRVRAL